MILNALIGIIGIWYGLTSVNKKFEANAGFTFMGMSRSTTNTFGYIGIGCFVLLVLMELNK